MTRFTIQNKNKAFKPRTTTGNLGENPEKKRAIRQRVILLFFSGIFIVSTIAALLLPAVTQAATLTSKSDLKNQVYTFATYNAMLDCLNSQNDIQMMDSFGFGFASYRTNDAHLKSGDWWRTDGSLYWGTIRGAEAPSSYLNPKAHSDFGNSLCNDIVKAAAPLFGYDSIFSFACAFIDNHADGSSCATGSGDDFKDFSASAEKFKSVMSKRLWSSGTPKLTLNAGDNNAGLYIIYREAFLNGCSPKVSTAPSADFAYKDIRIIQDDGTETTKTYEGINRGDSRSTYEPAPLSTESKSCGDIASLVNKYANDFKAYLKENPTDAGSSANPTQKCPSDDTILASSADCKVAGPPAPVCAVDGIGWIICPVVTFLAGVADSAFGFLANNFLQTNPDLLNTQGKTYAAWSYMRTFANVAFVIVFLIIIFSQLTGIGVSNYGVKKLLPRIVIAAILVNVSFFICQLAVDVSNILGFSIKDTFDSVSKSIDTSSVSSAINSTALGDETTGQGFAGIAGSVLAWTIVGVGGYALLSTLIPVILAAVVALLLILFILVARQALVVLLIVASPLAFVAFLLPNTESLFKQWRKMLTAMLLLFPIVAAVFGASTLASTILNTSFGTTTDGTPSVTGDTHNIFGQIISAAILVLPLFAVPVLLKKSLDGIPVLGKMVGNLTNRANGNVSKKLSESNKGSLVSRGLAYRKAGTEAYRSQRFAKRVEKNGFASAIAKGVSITPAGIAGRRSLAKSAVEKSEAADAEEVKAAETLLRSQHSNPTDLITQSQKALTVSVTKGDTVGARAAQNILLNSGGAGIKALQSTLTTSFAEEGSQNTEVGTSLRTALNRAGLKPKNNALATWAYNGKTLTATTKDATTFSGLSDTELGGHSLDNLNQAFSSGVLTPERAKGMLSSPVVVASMGKVERDFVQSVSEGPGFIGPQTEVNTPTDTNLNIPH